MEDEEISSFRTKKKSEKLILAVQRHHDNDATEEASCAFDQKKIYIHAYQAEQPVLFLSLMVLLYLISVLNLSLIHI